MADYRDDGGKRKVGGCLGIGLAVVLVLVLVLVGLASFRTGGEPEITIEPSAKGIGARTPIEVRVAEGGRGIDDVRVELVQGDRVEVIAEKEYTPRQAWAFWGPRTAEDTFTVEVGRATVPNLRSGDATVRVVAERAGTWMRNPEPAVAEVTLPVRLTPPQLSVISNQHYVNQGGAEVVVYRVGDTAVRSGVEAGDWWFPGFDLPGGGAGEKFALFAVPYDVSDQGQVKLIAVDDVGNRAEAGFIDRFTPKPPSEGTIELTDAFMGRVVPEIINNSPGFEDKGGVLENYLAINGAMREQNRQRLVELGGQSAEEFLFHEPFLPMPGGQVMSPFATHRTYVYNGKEVDEAFHLGFDLASTQRAPVPAAANGRVLLAEYHGIYGNAVVLDHGYGVMTLYGHLSSFDVQEGQTIERGQSVGRTGQTGLAGGDHLHYEVMLRGHPTTPVEWWDRKWLTDRLSRKLGDSWSLGQPGQAGQQQGGQQQGGEQTTPAQPADG